MTTFTSVIVLIALVNCSTACSCLFTKPETAFYGFELVIEGVVNDVQEIVYEDGYGKYFGVPDELKHNVTVIRVFRNFDDIDVENGDTLSFYTPGSRPMCGIRLAVNKPYLITAYKYNSRLQFNRCSWLPRMTVLTREQINGIEGGYDCTGM